MITTTTRNASLSDLAALLQDQQARKVDIVAPASTIRSSEGTWVVQGAEQIITLDGVTTADGRYVPTAVADEGVADKLGIPVAYLRRMRTERPDLYDANLNGWLRGRKPMLVGGRVVNGVLTRGNGRPIVRREAVPADPRSFLVRAFRGDDGETGIARAFLSDRYAVIDNLDALTAALDGVKASGADVQIVGCDLTDRRMSVKIAAPAVAALAPVLLAGYRSPFTGALGDENPTVFAGFVISNSETGGGAFTITPRITVQVCNNGMTITKDALRAVHLGGKLDAGVIAWSADTQAKAVELVTAKTRDAVATFLDPAYLERVVAGIEEQAGAALKAPADQTVREVGKALAFTQEHTAGVLEHFIRGGSMNAGGVMQAVTAYAQTVDDADVAADMEAQALRAMTLASA